MGWYKKMKIFEAMLFKREIGSSRSLDVKMLDTIHDGFILSIDQNLVKSKDLSFLTDFVNQHKLSLLQESERYFISTAALSPSIQYFWENGKK